MDVLLYYEFFFFQAEDGIRDLVRSRGLGDVYKRQALTTAFEGEAPEVKTYGESSQQRITTTYLIADGSDDAEAVSYTHLTLPTSDLV